MDHSTPATDLDALMAEVDALVAEGVAQGARVEALLQSTGTPAMRLADLALQLEQGRRELDAIERHQRVIERAIGAQCAP